MFVRRASAASRAEAAAETKNGTVDDATFDDQAKQRRKGSLTALFQACCMRFAAFLDLLVSVAAHAWAMLTIRIFARDPSLTPAPLTSLPYGDAEHKYTLVLDLDETLVCTTQRHVPHCDAWVEIQGKRVTRTFYILKRCGRANLDD